MKKTHIHRGARPGIALSAAAATILLAGCDVTSPGRIYDEDLNSAGALRVLVNGVAGDVTVAYQDFGWNAEVMTGGLSGTSAYDSRINHWLGRPQPEDADDYNSAWRAVWVADAAIDRIKSVLGDQHKTSAVAAEAYVWAGIINRTMGENFCAAVIDGGAPQDRKVYLQRAESYFTTALEIANAVNNANLRTAAYAGRASVRINLGKWPEAVADAGQVPTAFTFNVVNHATSTREWNRLFEENHRRTNINVRHTFFETYSNETKDPRTPTLTRQGVTAADGSGLQVMQGKYMNHGVPIVALSGKEARLIEWEDMIVNKGQWQQAMAQINARRATLNVPAWTANSQAEALNAFKTERSIDLWLEHRRAGDLLRWGGTAAGDPILARMYQNAAGARTWTSPAPLAQRATCLPFSARLLQTNPNLQTAG